MIFIMQIIAIKICVHLSAVVYIPFQLYGTCMQNFICTFVWSVKALPQGSGRMCFA